MAEGQLATRDIVAPRALDYESQVQTDAARAAAKAAVPPQYTFTSENAIAIAAAQQLALEDRVSRVDTTFSAELTPAGRKTLLQTAVPDLSETANATLAGLDAARWAAVRTESARILDATLRTELRDSAVADTRGRLAGLMAGGLDEAERMLAAELISPLIVPNSSFSQPLWDTAKDKAAEAVVPVRETIRQGEVIVRNGTPLSATDIEKIDALGLRETAPDVASFAGWLLLAVLVVGILLAWIWRFRPGLWHRDNVLVLIGLLVVGATLALKITAGRPTLPYFLPTAAIAILLTILLDASTATIVIAIVAIIGGAVNGGSLEFAAYIFLGGMAGIVAVRKGDRLQAFVQASLAVLVVNALVVTVFSLLGARDLRGVLELWFASAASAAGSGVAAVGTFAVLGSVFGILTVFQLLELANPSQPLLRRLLVETPGTYHHSLMVGNLAERAAEAIGADPLMTRVAAYYHDVGKLANPLAFIENQAGGDNIHDQLDPAVSAGILKQHVADGIDLAYKSRLPKALIAFIPQHHGTAIMSYFYARAKELAGPGVIVDERTLPARRAQATVARGGPDHARRQRRGVRPVAVLPRRTGHPGDGVPDHRGAGRRRPVRRVRPHPSRPRASSGRLRRPAARDVPHPDRLPAEHGGGARIAPRAVAAAGAAPGRAWGAARRRDPGDLPRPVADRPRRPGRRLAADRRCGARAGDRRGADGRRGTLAGLDRPDPDGRRGAGRRSTPRISARPARPTCSRSRCCRPRRFPVTRAAPRNGRPARPRRAPAFPLPPGRRPHLGDIVVSVERAVEQAEGGRGGQTGDVRWSPADELRLLVTHGALHICGWDHAEPAEEAAMRALEGRLLA